MKKFLPIFILCLFAIGKSSAQERMIFYNGANPVYSQPIQNIDSVCFQNNISVVHNNQETTDFMFPVVGIDSIVFSAGNVPADTAGYPDTAWTDPDTSWTNPDTNVLPAGDTVFITYNGGNANIINPWSNRGVTVTANGAHVAVNALSGTQDIVYYLSGSTANGSLTMNSDHRFYLILHNASITNPSGAAIKLIDDVKITAKLEGISSLVDGGDETSHKAVFDSEGQIVFDGAGTLNVTGNVKHGIFSNDYVRILNGNFKVNSAVTDGFHADYFQMAAGSIDIDNAKTGIDGDRGFIQITGGTIDINVASADGKGFKCDSVFYISGGNVLLTLTGAQSKGVKAGKGIILNGGDITINGSGATVVTANDPSHCTGLKSDANVIVNAGSSLTVTMNSAAAGGKAINADGNVFLNGGTINLSVAGAGGTYTNANNQSDSYSASCIKSNGRIEVDSQTGNTDVTLTASGADGKGFSADSDVILHGGTFHITASGSDSKGVKADNSIMVNGGTYTVIVSGVEAKGFSADNALTLNGGDFTMTLSGNVSKGLKSDVEMQLLNGTTHITASGSTVVTSGNPAYCTGIKADGTLDINGGSHTITCTSTNTGGRCISSTGSMTIGGGMLTLKTQGSGTTYTSGNTTDAYGPVCIKADGNLTVTAGVIDCQSTGSGGRGIKVDGTCTIGVVGGDNEIIDIDIMTSGAPIGSSGGGGGGWWPGGGGGSSSNYCKPKGLKVLGDLTINSGHISSYCAQTSGDPTAEAIESKAKITINGGFVEANAYDDAINSQEGFVVTGGYVWAYARGNDGIDNNGTSVAQATNLTGGVIIAAGTEEAIDANIDRGGTFYINGATVIGYYASSQGGMGIFDNPTYQNGQKYVIPFGTNSSATANTAYCLKNSGGTPVMIYRHPSVSGSGFMSDTEGLRPPPGGGSNGKFVFTSPDITSGTYTLYTNPTITGTANWHGLYVGASATTSGSGTSVTAQ